jgi:hypothetical protein
MLSRCFTVLLLMLLSPILTIAQSSSALGGLGLAAH